MPGGAFRLRLDTHAPQLTWGAIAGTHAGELLRVAYSLDEPRVDSATLRLPDGRQVAMLVRADRLEALVPYDAPTGRARITARLLDDVGNQATAELALDVAGGVGPAPAPTALPRVQPSPGRSRPEAPTPEREVRVRTRAVASSSSRVTARREGRTTVTGSSRARVRTAHAGRSIATASSRGRLVGGSDVLQSTAVATSRGGVVRRDMGDELALLLL
jgi:hypothetical protein